MFGTLPAGRPAVAGTGTDDGSASRQDRDGARMAGMAGDGREGARMVQRAGDGRD